MEATPKQPIADSPDDAVNLSMIWALLANLPTPPSPGCSVNHQRANQMKSEPRIQPKVVAEARSMSYAI